MNVPSRSPYIDYQLLAKHIRKYRKLRSLTQADLAIKLGYKTRTNYGKVCLCFRNVRTKKALYALLGIQGLFARGAPGMGDY